MDKDDRPFWESATKIVFILMALGLLLFTYIGKVEGKEFMFVIGLVFGAYYKS